jgi:methylated-DNA-[protein]-cysteine S-methyltransferase
MIVYAGLPDTPIGTVWAAVADDQDPAVLVNVHIGGSAAEFARLVERHTGREPVPSPAAVTSALAELDAYLHGRRRTFTLPLDWSRISGFQREVLDLVVQIPYGRTRTYGDLAQEIGRRGAARAVGRANATNPLPLVIPCHRVIGRDGKLHGYGGGNGIETKAWLLRLEGSRLI